MSRFFKRHKRKKGSFHDFLHAGGNTKPTPKLNFDPSEGLPDIFGTYGDPVDIYADPKPKGDSTKPKWWDTINSVTANLDNLGVKPKGGIVDFAPHNPVDGTEVWLPNPNGGVTVVSGDSSKKPKGGKGLIINTNVKGDTVIDYAPGGGSHPNNDFANPRNEVLGEMENKFLEELPAEFVGLWKKAKAKFGEPDLENIYILADNLSDYGEFPKKSLSIIKTALVSGANHLNSVRDYVEVLKTSIDKQSIINPVATSTSEPTPAPKKDKTLEYIAYGVIGYVVIKKLFK